MHLFILIAFFFGVLGTLVISAALSRKKTLRVGLAVGVLLWSSLMFIMASWAEKLKYNHWYSTAAANLLDESVSAIESGRHDDVLRELKNMRSELQVTYEHQGNFRELADAAATRLAEGNVEIPDIGQ